MSRAAVAAAAVLATGCVHDFRWPGTLPGEAQGVVQVAVGPMSSKTVHADGTPNQRDGTLTTARYTMGFAIGTSRFGTMSGFDASVGAGWLTGDAASLEPMADTKQLYVDSELGGMIQPLALRLGPATARALVDFGVGTSVDDAYRYAGLRVGVGAFSRRWALDAAYRRRFGDTPGNADAHEDHARATLTVRRSRLTRTVHLGFEYVRGDQRTLDGAGGEVARADYLLRGRYELMFFVYGYGSADPPNKVDLAMH